MVHAQARDKELNKRLKVHVSALGVLLYGKCPPLILLILGL